MSALRPSRHAIPAALVALAALLAPLMGSADGTRFSASATAKAAQHAERPAAEAFPLDGADVATARRLADQHWGSAACGGQVTISWGALAPDTNATATWRNPTDAWANAGENFDCAIELNTAVDYDFAKLCTVLTHELGHLLGHDHSEQEGDLMDPVYRRPLPACAAAAPAADHQADSVSVPARRALRRTSAAKRRCVRRLSAKSSPRRCGNLVRTASKATRAKT